MVSSAIIAAVKETGMPDGVFSNLNSSGIEVGQWLVHAPRCQCRGLYGKHQGRYGAFINWLPNGKCPFPVYAEMGSINPVIALPSALEQKADTWAENLRWINYGRCGAVLYQSWPDFGH